MFTYSQSLTASGIVINFIRSLSILWLNKFHKSWFWIVWGGWVYVGLRQLISTGMCNTLRTNKSVLLIFVHCSALNFDFCSTAEFFFKKSTITLHTRWSVLANFVEESRLLISNIACRPISVLLMVSTESRHSTGTVKFTNIFINNSIVLSSLVLIKRGMRSFGMFWPKLTLLRYVRKSLSSDKMFWSIDSKAAERGKTRLLP